MDGLDKLQQIADAEFSVAVLANLETSDFQFVPVEPVAEDTAMSYHGRGLAFIGLIGLVKGQPKCALDVPLESEDIAQLVQAFLAHLRKNMRWIARPDMRAN